MTGSSVRVRLVALTDQWNGLAMGLTAENLAEMYDISREEQDEFACRSHLLAAEARESGRFGEEIVGVEIKDRKGNVLRVVADVNAGVCQGCGTCVAVCRSNSVDLDGFKDEQIYSQILALE